MNFHRHFDGARFRVHDRADVAHAAAEADFFFRSWFRSWARSSARERFRNELDRLTGLELKHVLFREEQLHDERAEIGEREEMVAKLGRLADNDLLRGHPPCERRFDFGVAELELGRLAPGSSEVAVENGFLVIEPGNELLVERELGAVELSFGLF